MKFISINNLYLKTEYIDFIYKCDNGNYLIFFNADNKINNSIINQEIYDTDNFIINSDIIIDFILNKNDKYLDDDEKKYIFKNYPFDDNNFKYIFDVLYNLYHKNYFTVCNIGYIFTETDITKLEKYMNS